MYTRDFYFVISCFETHARQAFILLLSTLKKKKKVFLPVQPDFYYPLAQTHKNVLSSLLVLQKKKKKNQINLFYCLE